MMKIQTKYRKPAFLAGIALLVSGLLYAVAVFSPSTTPTVMLGKYALQNNDLLQGDTRAYRTWFENGAWQGDVIEYDILADGTRQTDAVIGSNPPIDGTDPSVLPVPPATEKMCGGTGCWMARYSFQTAEDDASPPGSYWKDRNIFTNSGGQVDFLWDNLSAAQKLALDSPTLSDPDGDPTTADAITPTDTSTEGDYFSPILNYVRGDRSKERDKTGGFLRKRYSVLGDITASPAYIGPPKSRLDSFEGYTEYRSSEASRAGRIAVPANDGMLHVFDEVDGSEVYAYVPSMVINNLPALAARDTTYSHTYYVAGDPVASEAQINAGTCTADDISGCNWHTVLSGGGGPGFSGLYALDVTDPAYPGSGNKLLFEKSGSEFGHIYGKPVIAPLGTQDVPEWYAFTGNGYALDDSTRSAKLLMVSLDSGAVTSISAGANSRGLSQPALLSTNNDLIVDVAFAGDINGDVWMFQIDPDTATGTATLIFDGSTDQPITVTPALTEHPSLPGSYMLYFGTGSLLSITDTLNDTSQQSIYGILIKKAWLDGTETVTPISYASSDLVTQTFGTESKQFIAGEPINEVRVYSSTAAVDFSTKSGWKVDLTNCGERLVGDPFLRAQRLQFVTTNPTGPAPNCSGDTVPGESWLMSLDYLTGGDGGEVVFNLNGDSILDNGDAVDITSAGETVYLPPVGLNLGVGNIAQPSFVRLGSGIDKMYINGIILPVPVVANTGAILSGHIDVQTDSPYSGEEAVNDRSALSEGYQDEVADGLGQAVDGHVHGYDTIHLVDYVDLFELEPRRGLLSPDPDTAGQTLEPELNRAYDNYTFFDPVPDATGAPSCPAGSTAILDDNDVIIQCQQAPASEVYADTAGTARLPASSQKFIVTLANADLSFAGTLQIGCRAWPVVDYENKVTAQLEATTLAYGDSLPAYFADNSLVFTLSDILNSNPDDGPCPYWANDPDMTQIGDAEVVEKGLSHTPTLRIGFGQRSILDQGLLGTRAQCVLGLHHYDDKACYTDEDVLSAAKAALADGTRLTGDAGKLHYGASSRGGTGDSCALFDGVGIADVPDYVRDPAWNMHVTYIKEGSAQGYRWRNGALTLQLQAVNSDGTVGFTLQPPTEVVYDTDGSTITKKDLMVSKNKRFGGTYARAWGWKQEEIPGVSVCDPVTLLCTIEPTTYTTPVWYTNEEYTDATLDTPAEGATVGPHYSGLLYEASMFWHYSDLNDGLRNADPDSNSSPQDTNCYGNSNYQSSLTKEQGGLTLGEYNSLVNPLLDECEQFHLDNPDPEAQCDLEKYIDLVRILETSTDEDEIAQALLDLANLVQNNDLLKQYAKYRDYAPGHVPEQHLLDIDKGLAETGTENSSNIDGTPSDVTTIETLDRESLGPNLKLGRRNWIDLRQ